MSTVAVIPARGGSVRIPKKNIKHLWGKPLIQYAIESAIDSGVVDRVIVSTDDPDIADVAIKLGAEVPFVRPIELSGDVPTEQVVMHAINEIETDGYIVDKVICLEPPVPFRNKNHIRDCIMMLERESVDSVVTVTKITERPEWMLSIENGLVKPYTDRFINQGGAFFNYPSSMDLPQLYRVIGVVIGCKRHVLSKYNSITGINCQAYLLPGSVCIDLDWPEDWERCELLKPISFE